jgi:hypothetical protein
MISILNVISAFLVLVSYSVVFKNEKSYLESKYWLGINKTNVKVAVIFQVLALLGFLIFSTWLSGIWGERPQKGLLTYKNGNMGKILILVFLISSIFWAPLTKRAFTTNNLLDVILACIPLWIAALATIGLVAGAFENPNTPYLAFIGIILFSIVIINLDGIGWSARFISLFNQTKL